MRPRRGRAARGARGWGGRRRGRRLNGARRAEPGGRGRLQKAAWIAAPPAGPHPETPRRARSQSLPGPRRRDRGFLLPNRRQSRQRGTETSSLPRRARAEGARGAGPALGALPRPLQSSLRAGRVNSARAARPSPPGCELGAGPDDPRVPFRPGIVGGRSRRAQPSACTSQGAVSQLNHRGSFPANKSPAHREKSPSHSPVFETSRANSVKNEIWPVRPICSLLHHS